MRLLKDIQKEFIEIQNAYDIYQEYLALPENMDEEENYSYYSYLMRERGRLIWELVRYEVPDVTDTEVLVRVRDGSSKIKSFKRRPNL